MRAEVGDRIVLAAEHVDGPTRDGRVVEVRGADGGPPYLVEWTDGHTGLLFPGPGSVLRVGASVPHARPGAPAPAPAPAPNADAAGEPAVPQPSEPTHEWTIRVSVHPGDDSIAHAVLVVQGMPDLEATGASHRSPADPADPRIGEEVAVARALRHLADEVLQRATAQVTTSTGEARVRIAPF